MQRLLTVLIYILCGVLGLSAFAYPFVAAGRASAGAGLAPSQAEYLVAAGLVGLSVIALLIELQGQTMGAKTVAMLGVLVSGASILRFLDKAVPFPGGFSPIFAPILLAGFAFGCRFGFLMGTFTLLVSGLITGGVGPWLPYQMFAAGWVGVSGGLLAFIPLRRRADVSFGLRELLLLAIAGFVWGILYGAIMNLYTWPLIAAASGQRYQPGAGLLDVLANYGAYYLATSLPWDMARAVGNVALLLVLGAPMVRALRRFGSRFGFEVSADA